MIYAAPRIAVAALSLTALSLTSLKLVTQNEGVPRAQPPSPSAARWTSIGSSPSWNGTSQYAWAGRVTAIAIHPSDANILYAGAASGGVWKTTNGGQSWTPLTDSQPSLATGSLALDPSDANIIYVGTGEQMLGPASLIPPGSLYGAGILKSTDGGATWRYYPGPFAGPLDASPLDGGARIGSLAVSQADGQVVLAAADFGQLAGRSGIYRSSDGGATWALVLGGAAGTEVLFDVSDANVAYAALGSPAGSPLNGVYKSVDGGATWANMSGIGATAIPAALGGRIRLAQAASKPSTMFAAVSRSYTGANGVFQEDAALGVFKTTDGGATWNTTSAPDYCGGGSCNYHETIKIHPLDADTVVVGGIQPYLSTDGGATWSRMEFDANGTQLHPDTQTLAWTADGSRLYIGCDGGIFSPSNLAPVPDSWTSLNNTLAVTQFYPGMSIHPTEPSITYAGSQDNGVQKYSGNSIWQDAGCGDGGATAIQSGPPYTVFIECAGDGLYKLAGDPPSPVSVGMGNQVEGTPFLAAVTIDPNNSSRLYFGTYRVWVTNDAATTWSPISPDLADHASSQSMPGVTAIAVAPADSNTVYAASGTVDVNRIWVSTNALSGTQANWTDITDSLPQRQPTRIAVDPANPTVAYLSVSGFSGFNGDNQGHVFKTTDRGVSWSDVSGSLPNLPVNDLLADPDLPSTVYAATDKGVYETLDGGVTWSVLATGLPNAPVESLALYRPLRLLRVGTFGRGAWELSVPTPSQARKLQRHF
jgi:photosystem II stability/assembly factor-like uncharacterized protein